MSPKNDSALKDQMGSDATYAAGKRKDAGSTPRYGSPFFSKIVIDRHCLVTLPCTIFETVKWLTSLARLNAEIIPVVTV